MAVLITTGCEAQPSIPADTAHMVAHRQLTDSARTAAIRGDTAGALG